MKKKVLNMLLIMAMGMSLLAGCGGNGSETAEKEVTQENVSEKEEVIPDEVDFSSYEEIEVNTVENKSLKVYYNPEVIVDWYTEYAICVAYNEEGNEYPFEVVPFESAEEYRSSEIFEHEMWEHQNIEATELEEISIGGHTVHSFNIKYQDDLTGEPIDYSSDIGIIELDDGLVFCFGLGNEGIEEVLSAITFTKEQDSASAADENGDVADSNSENAERDLQTCGILDMKIDNTGNVTHEETGILTYDASKVEFVNADEFGVEFDVSIKEGKTKYITPVKLSIVSYADTEEFYQEWKSTTLEFDPNAEVSEMKETVINEIPVGYFTRVYHSKDGEHENRDLYCFIDFPTIDNREKGLEIWTYYNLEEELHLNSLKDLLIDIEIQGVKPGAAGEKSAAIEKIEIDRNIYSAEEQVETSERKTVKIYYDPNVISRVDTMTEGMFLPYDMNNDRCLFIVGDGVVENIGEGVKEAYGDAAEYTEVAEALLGEYTVYSFQMIHEDGYTITYAYIDLGSEVLLQIDEMHNDFDESALEEVVNAMRFEVE